MWYDRWLFLSEMSGYGRVDAGRRLGAVSLALPVSLLYPRPSLSPIDNHTVPFEVTVEVRGGQKLRDWQDWG